MFFDVDAKTLDFGRGVCRACSVGDPAPSEMEPICAIANDRSHVLARYDAS
jgi:hypothetical protein